MEMTQRLKNLIPINALMWQRVMILIFTFFFFVSKLIDSVDKDEPHDWGPVQG